MAVYFFDSSALVKRYAHETGSDWIAALTEPSASHALYIARITAVEDGSQGVLHYYPHD